MPVSYGDNTQTPDTDISKRTPPTIDYWTGTESDPDQHVGNSELPQFETTYPKTDDLVGVPDIPFGNPLADPSQLRDQYTAWVDKTRTVGRRINIPSASGMVYMSDCDLLGIDVVDTTTPTPVAFNVTLLDGTDGSANPALVLTANGYTSLGLHGIRFENGIYVKVTTTSPGTLVIIAYIRQVIAL